MHDNALEQITVCILCDVPPKISLKHHSYRLCHAGLVKGKIPDGAYRNSVPMCHIWWQSVEFSGISRSSHVWIKECFWQRALFFGSIGNDMYIAVSLQRSGNASGSVLLFQVNWKWHSNFHWFSWILTSCHGFKDEQPWVSSPRVHYIDISHKRYHKACLIKYKILSNNQLINWFINSLIG